MEFELRELSQSVGRKAMKIIVLNIVMWTATMLGYSYIQAILAADTRGAGKLAALVFMSPVFTLFCSIMMGTTPQKLFAAGEQGIRWGDAVEGIRFYRWTEIQGFELAADTYSVKLLLPKKSEPVLIPLKSYGITTEQYQRLQQWSQAALVLTKPSDGC